MKTLKWLPLLFFSIVASKTPDLPPYLAGLQQFERGDLHNAISFFEVRFLVFVLSSCRITRVLLPRSSVYEVLLVYRFAPGNQTCCDILLLFETHLSFRVG